MISTKAPPSNGNSGADSALLDPSGINLDTITANVRALTVHTDRLVVRTGRCPPRNAHPPLQVTPGLSHRCPNAHHARRAHAAPSLAPSRGFVATPPGPELDTADRRQRWPSQPRCERHGNRAARNESHSRT